MMPRSGIPQPDSSVVCPSENMLAIRGKIRPIEWRLMPQSEPRTFARYQIPNLCRMVVATRHHAVSIRAKRGMKGPRRMFQRFEHQFPRFNIPHAGLTTFAGANDPL